MTGLTIILLLSVVRLPLGPFQLTVIELNSTPPTVLTMHSIPRGLPTMAPCIGPDGNMVIAGSGTTV